MMTDMTIISYLHILYNMTKVYEDIVLKTYKIFRLPCLFYIPTEM